MSRGSEVRLEFTSSDARTAAAMTIYDWDGVAVTLASHQRVVITTIVSLVVAAAMTLDVFSDNDADAAVDNGERLISGAFAANGGIAIGNLATPLACKRGITPKVKTSASGAVAVILTGYVMNG